MTDRILIIAPSWVGDAVMAQPLYRRLKDTRPGCHITVMAPAWTRALGDRMPEVDATLDNPFAHGQLRLKDRWKLGRSMRGQFDQVIVLPNSLKSALLPWFAGIARRTGFVGEARYGLLNDARPLDKAALPMMVERFAILAEAKGGPVHKPVGSPRFAIDPARADAARVAQGLSLDRPVVAFCPGAEYGPAKRWPARHFAALADQLHAEGYAVWMFGSGKDVEHTQAIASAAQVELVDLAGKTSLDQAIDLLSLVKVVVSNDSGLMHVAAALDKPMVALYGSSSPGFTPPLTDKAEIVSLGVPCSPCFERQCPLKHFDCMEKMDAERVRAAVKRVVG
ncbi:lipopolysaccharide heptosyltransferase II [Burkholderiaceae bacterium DAT-1]|nr:lipopolysaccharide heptosyltransferase II [Burkholderiaceae bacterium DAT-1]